MKMMINNPINSITVNSMVNDAVSLTPAMSIMAHNPSNNSATDNSGVLKRAVKYREKPMATVAPPITLPAMIDVFCASMWVS